MDVVADGPEFGYTGGKPGRKRPTAAMAAKLTGHIWSFAELFETVMPAKVAA
jgi:hypothetical protein